MSVITIVIMTYYSPQFSSNSLFEFNTPLISAEFHWFLCIVIVAHAEKLQREFKLSASEW